MSEQWLSIVEYARAYNVSDMTVRRRIRNGKLNAVLKDGKYFIPISALVSQGAVLGPIAKTRNISVTQTQEQYVQQPDPFVQGQPITSEKPQGMVHPTSHGTIPSSYQQAAPVQPVGSRLNQPQKQSLQMVQKGHVPVSLSGVIPNDITAPMNTEDNTSLAARNLLGFCESMAKRLEKSEKNVRKEYDSKIKEMEMSGKAKDLELNQLKQQVEDLQLLVNIIDRNK